MRRWLPTSAVVAMTEDWRQLLGTSEACECGRTHTVPTREVVIGAAALEGLSDVLARHCPGRRGAMIADEVTWEVAGRRAVHAAHGWDLSPIVLRPQVPGHSLKADEAAVAQVQAALPGELDFLVCVGSGTLNDLTKVAATERGVPSVCVATAPSMNGYPSAIAALSRGGIKRTEACEPPVAIVCDTEVLSAAPERMVQAGLGDLLSKSTSSADWLVAHLLRGEFYCERPVRLLSGAEELCVGEAGAIGRREPAAVERLITGLIVSGIGMALSGASSPASGGEHLLSHYWDMTAEARRREPDLHGRQVAVATLMAGRLYEGLRDRAAPVSADRQPAPGRAESLAHFAPLVGPEAAEEIATLLLRKQLGPEATQEALRPLRESPEGFWRRVRALQRPRAEIERAYLAAGVPTTPAEIGVSPEEARAALLFARHIRDRYTVLDLAADLGLLEELAAEIAPVSDRGH